MANTRTCIVSRKTLERDALLRFVAGPENRIYPDLKEALPGRGVWVEARRSAVEAAVSRKLFSRSLKAEVTADPELADLVARLLGERALQALGLARKAGLVVSGHAKCEAAIRSNKADLLLHATDAAEDGKRKLAQAITATGHLGGDPVMVAECWESGAMSSALGQNLVMHAVAQPGGATRNLIAAIRRWQNYEDALPLQGRAR